MRVAQAEQETRTNALAASVEQTVTDGAALTGLVRAQAATLATLGDTVAKLDQNFSALNTTMTLLLEKVTQLTEEKKKKPPRNADILQRPPSPTPPAVVRKRPEDDANDDEEAITQVPGSQRVRSTQ